MKITFCSFRFCFFGVIQSCRETVPPETLKDETSEQECIDVDLGNYDDEP